PSAVVASSSATAILCNGGSSTVTVSATGGTAPYTGTGTFTETAGTYTYTVTDANGCTATTTITITQPAVLVASSSATAILCNGGSSTVTVTATGGTAPYTGTGTFSRTAGTWSFTVTDANGCTSTTSVTISEPSQLVASASATGSILCFGGTTTVNVTATGGTAPYSGTGSFNQGAGTITYTVTDANGCTASSPVTLTQPTKVEGTTTTTPASGCSVADGTATVTATGGTGSYTYLWSPGGQTTATATGLVAGSYTVSITDGNGCSGSATAVVSGSGGSVGTPSAISGPAGACRNTSGIVYSVINDPNATSYTWTLPSGATGSSTTNSITVAFGSGFNGGFISVVANSPCGSSMPSSLNIPVLVLYPSLPAVISGPSVTCGAGVYTFSTSSANATSYNWTVTGTGVFIASGQGTNTITVSVPVNFAQGSVQVRGVNCNGISAVRGMTITGIPAHSNAVSGPNLVCANGTATYSMPVVPGVTTYTWSITGDASLGSQNLTSTTSSGTFNFGPSWTSGQVSITVSNSCGSYTRTFSVGSVPNQPGGISGPGTALCNLTGVTYSIAAVPGATSYNWSVPAGATIVSTAPNGLSIVVDFTPAFTSNAGNICVSANNACGTGPARCFKVTSRPAVPVITGPASVCKSQSSVTYTLAPVTGATGYTWSVTGGASIAPSGTSAVVNYNTALTSSAVVRANAVNACGASQPATLAVAVNQFCRTAADNGSINTAEFSVYPNPTSAKTTVSFNSESDMKFTVKVADLLGNIIYSDVINASVNYNSTEINMTDFAKGVYVISVTSEDGNSQSKRVVVE
ncbi:MAG: T9SS type A sorting domain-containing protein, partial [Bacteroidota bacterium]